MALYKMHTWVGAVTLFLAVNADSIVYAGFVGHTVSLSREIPSSDFVFGPLTFVAQTGSADTVAVSGGNNWYVNVEDSSLLFTFGPGGGSGGPFEPMDHYVLFKDLSPDAMAIAGLSFETDLNGFDASYLTFTSHTIKAGQGGLDWTGGQLLRVDVQFAPEPSGLLLFTVGFLATVPRLRRSPISKGRRPDARSLFFAWGRETGSISI
jgi:hypothetical protein